jgi:hypothetical protein
MDLLDLFCRFSTTYNFITLVFDTKMK